MIAHLHASLHHLPMLSVKAKLKFCLLCFAVTGNDSILNYTNKVSKQLRWCLPTVNFEHLTTKVLSLISRTSESLHSVNIA